MLDTIILTIPRGSYKLKPETFTPNANILKTPGNFLVKCVNNPTATDKKNEVYRPRMTLMKRMTKNGSEIPLKVEFSVAKMLFGNNVDEVQESDFDAVVKALVKAMRDMGALVTEEVVKNAKVSAFHPSKNIELTSGYTSNFVITELHKIDVSKKMDLNRDSFRKIRGGSEKDGFLTTHFFAELPMEAILNKWTEYSQVNSNDKDTKNILDTLEKYSEEKDKTMKVIIKETLSKWIDNGLFVSEYAPLFLSDGFKTWNGNTKKKHRDIFNEWYKEIQKTKEFLVQMTLNGDIKVEDFQRKLFNTSTVIKVITGHNLYTSHVDNHFVTEYKKQIELLIPITYTLLFIKKYSDPLGNLVTLKSFLELSDFFSEIFEIDMSRRYEKNLDSFKHELLALNQTIGKQLDNVNEMIHAENKLFPILEINEDAFFFKEEDSWLIMPDTIIDGYKKNINKAGFTIK